MSFDWPVLNWIQANMRCGFLDALMPAVTHLGDKGAVWILTALVLLCTRRYRRNGLLLFAGLFAGMLTGNFWLKPWIARPRPCWLEPFVTLLIANPADYSFPSGHTLASVISAVILTGTNRRFGFAAIPLAVLIAFSRLYLYVHFPSDVLAAALIGLFLGSVCLLFLRWKERDRCAQEE